ncbi:calcium:proton antiporter [Polynucleobacter sp. VK25]|uniref:calcium:proton antiporter n=1 Tax=Polynucleobacter sp. VK25 TaxID=1758398 RepID=UPI0021138A3C|nr:ionic transporter y4hA [Polynucleobacter sp. VK25]
MLIPLILIAALVVCILVSVHFAEVIALRVGQPYGSLLLALAVTIIEVALISSILLSKSPGSEAIVRDSIFATIMIVCNGLVGVCLIIGALKYNETIFKVDGTNITLGMLITTSVLVFVLPMYTTSMPGPHYNADQMRGAAIACFVLYAVYVYAQTIKHRDLFLPPRIFGTALERSNHEKPTLKAAIYSGIAIIFSLTAVVLLSKALAPYIENFVDKIGAPKEFVGVMIAGLVLLPESISAIRQASNNKMQNSFNLALGSGLASVGLTIPVAALISILTGITLTLGLDAKSQVFLLLTFIISIMTISTGRATFSQGMMHIVIFLAYIRLTITP